MTSTSSISASASFFGMWIKLLSYCTVILNHVTVIRRQNRSKKQYALAVKRNRCQENCSDRLFEVEIIKLLSA